MHNKIMRSPYLFQYCQKLVILSEDKTKVLLAKRKGEADYDGVYSFVGGKMETTDPSFVEGMRREKNEEIGLRVKVKVMPDESCYNWMFTKKDGNVIILTHIPCVFQSGEIELNKEEYSEYAWVPIADLAGFEPKIGNVTDVTNRALARLNLIDESNLVEI